jgi:hypothetical protein
MHRATSSFIMSAMKALTCSLIIALVVFSACASPASSTADADPVSGRWTGEWGPSPERQTAVVLELQWDGTKLTGTINPGNRPSEIGKASFNPETNAITMELDVIDIRGEMDHYSITGKVDGNRMSGTWTRKNGKGTFKISKG